MAGHHFVSINASLMSVFFFETICLICFMPYMRAFKLAQGVCAAFYKYILEQSFSLREGIRVFVLATWQLAVHYNPLQESIMKNFWATLRYFHFNLAGSPFVTSFFSCDTIDTRIGLLQDTFQVINFSHLLAASWAGLVSLWIERPRRRR